MEPRPRRHRHPDDPRTSAGWVQLTNHSPLITISNEVVPHYSQPVWSQWRRHSGPCVCRCACARRSTLFSSQSNSIWSERREHADSIFVWLHEKENTYCLFFTTDWFSFPSSCFFFFPACFLFSFALSIWLYWVISFPLAYGGLLPLQRPLWPFDCTETRFCTSVTDAANDWREAMGEESGAARGGSSWTCRVALQNRKK